MIDRLLDDMILLLLLLQSSIFNLQSSGFWRERNAGIRPLVYLWPAVNRDVQVKKPVTVPQKISIIFAKSGESQGHQKNFNQVVDNTSH